MGDIIIDINLMVCKFYTFVEMGYHGGYDSKVITTSNLLEVDINIITAYLKEQYHFHCCPDS